MLPRPLKQKRPPGKTPFRRYDATTGRFTGVDAMTEATLNLTPYQFGANSPVMYNDPTGLLANADFNDILNGLWNSPNGGQWSVNDADNLYFYGDETTADVFGTFAAVNKQFDFSSGGIGGGNSLSVNLFNTTGLTEAEVQKFNTLITEFQSTTIGQALIVALTAFEQIINVTHDLLGNSGAMMEYHYAFNELRTDDRLSNTDWNFNSLIETLSHELFHAYQDFSGINLNGDGNEPDAYIFESLFDRQYKLDPAFYDRMVVGNPSTQAEIGFRDAWKDFFDKGYSRTDYGNIYSNFIDGSVEGSHYCGPIDVSMGGYLIYNLLHP